VISQSYFSYHYLVDDEGSDGGDDDFPKGLNDIISGGLSFISDVLNEAEV